MGITRESISKSRLLSIIDGLFNEFVDESCDGDMVEKLFCAGLSLEEAVLFSDIPYDELRAEYIAWLRKWNPPRLENLHDEYLELQNELDWEGKDALLRRKGIELEYRKELQKCLDNGVNNAAIAVAKELDTMGRLWVVERRN